MRVTVNLDPDVYSFLTSYGGAKGMTISAAVGELIRRAEQAPLAQAAASRLQKNEYGYLEIAHSGALLTPEMVKEAAEDELV